MLPIAYEVSVSLGIPYIVIRTVEDIRTCWWVHQHLSLVEFVHECAIIFGRTVLFFTINEDLYVL
jgi:hypothetical protein